MTEDTKFILNELIAVKAKADMLEKVNIELITLLYRKGIINTQDIESFKKEMEKLA